MRDWIDYYCVRKVKWDGLWHALFKDRNGKENWDRCTEAEALKLAKKL